MKSYDIYIQQICNNNKINQLLLSKLWKKKKKITQAQLQDYMNNFDNFQEVTTELQNFKVGHEF